VGVAQARNPARGGWLASASGTARGVRAGIRLISGQLLHAKRSQICAVLNREHIPIPMGGSVWLKSHVDRLLHTGG